MHILLITRHYPPEISGGARRPFLYVAALRQAGHRVTVITPFDLKDDDSITVSNSAINRGISTRVNPSKPTFRTRLSDKLRPWVYWPDDNIRWARDVAETLEQSPIDADWMVTTSPPESLHYVGYALSRKFKVKWAAEMRDTWVENPHRKVLRQSRLRAWLERKIAKHYLSRADAITAVSEAVMSEARKYVRPSIPKCIIPHFCNKTDETYTFDPSTLNLVHTGGFTLSDHRRHLAPLLHALDNISAKRPELVFHIAGPLTKDEQDMAKQALTNIKWHGLVPLESSRAMQNGADGLVLYSPHGSHALPGKYAEYAMAQRPILYFGSGEWLNLVETPAALIPLGTGAVILEKGQQFSIPGGLSNDEAAKTLVKFLHICERESSTSVK